MPTLTKRRLLGWSLILAILAALAVWLEPTRVVWGWLRGEAFYQGRPTSWWRQELSHWAIVKQMVVMEKDGSVQVVVGVVVANISASRTKAARGPLGKGVSYRLARVSGDGFFDW